MLEKMGVQGQMSNLFRAMEKLNFLLGLGETYG